MKLVNDLNDSPAAKAQIIDLLARWRSNSDDSSDWTLGALPQRFRLQALHGPNHTREGHNHDNNLDVEILSHSIESSTYFST